MRRFAIGSQSAAATLPCMTRTLGRVLTAVAVLALAASILASCGDDDEAEASPDATIELAEYRYEVSGEIPRNGFVRLENTGEEFHMMGVAKLKDESTTLEEATEALKTDSEDDDAELYDEVGLPGSILGPGQSADISFAALEPGRYVVACFINVAGKETPHFLRGMTGEFTVTDEAADPPEADATYTATKGKALTGPAELDAGYHVLSVKPSGDGGRDLEPGIVKLDEGKTFADFAEAIKLFDEGPLPKNADEKLPGDFVISSFDFGDEGELLLGLDLSPGTYVLIAQDSDGDDVPEVPVEQIEITVS
jgi:hypothetical protein